MSPVHGIGQAGDGPPLAPTGFDQVLEAALTAPGPQDILGGFNLFPIAPFRRLPQMPIDGMGVSEGIEPVWPLDEVATAHAGSTGSGHEAQSDSSQWAMGTRTLLARGVSKAPSRTRGIVSGGTAKSGSCSPTQPRKA